MRYYIKTGLDMKIESSWPLPGAIAFQIDAVLADETTDILQRPLELTSHIKEDVLGILPRALPEKIFKR